MSLSESVRDLQVALRTIVNLENKLNNQKLVDIIISIVKTAQKGVTDATGNALHRLDETEPSIDTVKELVQGIPDALSYQNAQGLLPIQSAAWDMDAVKYLPILAKVGIKHNVSGRGMRGGLLVADPRDEGHRNTLQLLACLGSFGINYDTACLDVLKELRKDNILLKEDIKGHDLLIFSCTPYTIMKFEYLAEWDPDNLKTGTFDDLPLSHAIIKHKKDITRFHIYLQTALMHHPQHLGLLFQKDNSAKTAFERAIEKHKIEETFNVVKQCIPTDTDLPILHHVVRDAPKFTNYFTMRYLSATYLRDADGRSVTQVAIVSGSKTFQNDPMFYVKMTDDEIAELDPVTNQYPFLTCATGETSDLSTVYVLLSRNPSLLDKYIEQTTDEFAEEAIRRKRKADNDDDGNNNNNGNCKE